MSYDVLDSAVARLWPYLPDWSGGFNVRRSFLTDIFTSRDNTEQRRATRYYPRLGVEYSAVVQDDERRAANHWLRAWQNKPAVIPDFARWARLTADSAAAAGTIDVSPLPTWAAEGQRLVLCGVTTEEVRVASAVGTTITLDDPLIDAWPTGSVLRPTFFGLMDGSISTSRLTRGAARINVALDCYPDGEPPTDPGTAWETFNSREIFALQADFSSAPNLSELWPVEQVDFERGRTAQFRPIDRQERQFEGEFRGLGVTLATEIEQFFDRMKGRRTAFYVPSGEKDFTLATTASSGTSTFLHSGSDIADDFGSIDYADVETALAICMQDGSHIYRRITDIALSGGNSLITVNAAWGATLSNATVARISWMPVCRLASDEMTMSWQTPLCARTRLAFQTVKR